MPGIRLHHPELRNCVYTLIHQGRPLVRPMLCPMCHYIHAHKTYHLGLDGVGDVVVSEVVFARLEEAGLGELRASQEVRRPERMVMDMNDTRAPLVVSREHGPLRRVQGGKLRQRRVPKQRSR